MEKVTAGITSLSLASTSTTLASSADAGVVGAKKVMVSSEAKSLIPPLVPARPPNWDELVVKARYDNWKLTESPVQNFIKKFNKPENPELPLESSQTGSRSWGHLLGCSSKEAETLVEERKPAAKKPSLALMQVSEDESSDEVCGHDFGSDSEDEIMEFLKMFEKRNV